MLQEITTKLWQASEARKVCRVSLRGEALPRLVHPYGVFRSATNKILLHCWQVAGFTKAGGEVGYRNLVLNRITEIEILNNHFTKQEDFDPASEQYQEWVFHI